MCNRWRQLGVGADVCGKLSKGWGNLRERFVKIYGARAELVERSISATCRSMTRVEGSIHLLIRAVLWMKHTIAAMEARI